MNIFFFIKEWFIREFWIIEIYEKYTDTASSFNFT